MLCVGSKQQNNNDLSFFGSVGELVCVGYPFTYTSFLSSVGLDGRLNVSFPCNTFIARFPRVRDTQRLL